MANRAELGVLIIHGIGRDDGVGSTAKGYSAALQKRLRANGLTESMVAFQEVYWHQHVQPRQDQYWRQVEPLVRWDVLRRLILDYLADASTYRQVKAAEGRTTVYEAVHSEVYSNLRTLEDRITDVAPLVILAHSLGGHIMSNYVYDRQRRYAEDPLAGTPFLRMERLVSMVTFGCNLPLFVMAATPYVPITVPATELPDDLRRRGRWLNYYDKDDVLGWPLKPLRDLVDEAGRAAFDDMIDDIPINVGVPLLQSSNPSSHVGYWNDKDFADPVAKHIKGLLQAG